MKYMSVNEGTICGETPTLYGTLLFLEVKIHALEPSAGTDFYLEVSPQRATTPGSGDMKRCLDNMRSNTSSWLTANSTKDFS